MKTESIELPHLREGANLTRDEFIARWDMQPGLKHAELLGGIVRLKLMPTSEEHGGLYLPISMWLGNYEASTPGCKGNSGSSWYMRDDMPQPENSLRILPECGGQSSLLKRKGRHYLVGAPEFAAEVSLSSRTYDLGEKAELYLKAGVKELVCITPETGNVAWLRKQRGNYVELKSKDGILRSDVFPGLWLDPKALLKDDKPRINEVLRDGLSSPEHAAFVVELAARKWKSRA